MFRSDAVYNTRVDVSWAAPCEENGVISQYRLQYGKTSSLERQVVSLWPTRRVYVVVSLEMLTQYSFQLQAQNDQGWGPPLTFVVKTKGPASEFALEKSTGFWRRAYPPLGESLGFRVGAGLGFRVWVSVGV